jgi:hypothetical protein
MMQKLHSSKIWDAVPAFEVAMYSVFKAMNPQQMTLRDNPLAARVRQPLQPVLRPSTLLGPARIPTQARSLRKTSAPIVSPIVDQSNPSISLLGENPLI